MLQPWLRLALIGIVWSLATAAPHSRALADDLQLLRGLAANEAGGLADAADGTLEVWAQWVRAAEGEPARLFVFADIPAGWHIYSVTQPKGGPLATRIQLTASDRVRLAAPFEAAPGPHVGLEREAFGELPIESHEGRVVWHAPLLVAEGADAATLRIEGKLTAQACDESGCLPPKAYAFVAELAAAPPTDVAAQQLGALGTFRQRGAHATLEGAIAPLAATPGSTVRLTLTARPDAAYHVYAWAERPSDRGSQPTLIHLTETSGFAATAPRADSVPIEKPAPVERPADAADTPGGAETAEAGDGGTERYHEQPVTWTIELTIPSTARPGLYPVAGLLGYQTCTQQQCDPPAGVRFTALVDVAAGEVSGAAPFAFYPATYREAAALAAASATAGEIAGSQFPAGAGPDSVSGAPPAIGFDPTRVTIAADDALADTPLWWALVLGFAGGLILNLMPCVLPVIGLKLLSFVEQSGESRWRVLELNLWYTLGLLSVFMLLATLAAVAGLGWGAQFQNQWFNIVLAGVVFAMALSFLGVWEIPIPGFVGGRTANQLQQKEGLAGAFAKGMITTVLATPCSGPFLGTALAWALRQPPLVIYATFASVGLGMASPYLLVGAFPRLIRFLPKPGMWMETFKHLMGFVLLATVVYLFSVIPAAMLVPTLALLFGIWLACWWIGRTPLTAPAGQQVTAWLTAGMAAALVGVIAFGWLAPITQSRHTAGVERLAGELAGQLAGHTAADGWLPFSQQRLTALTQDQKTVLVDFTADWCLTCKTLESTVLNTEATRAILEANGVVTLKADWTDGSPEVTEMLDLLGSKQIPVVALFPAGRPNEPIVFRGWYSKEDLHEALRRAGPSVGGAETGPQAAETAPPHSETGPLDTVMR